MLFLVSLDRISVLRTCKLLAKMVVAAVRGQLFLWVLSVLARIKLNRLLEVIVLVKLTLIKERELRLNAWKLRQIINLTLVYVTRIFLDLVQVEIHDFVGVVRSWWLEQLIGVQESRLSQISVFHIDVSHDKLRVMLLRYFLLLGYVFRLSHCLLLLFEQLILLKLLQTLLWQISNILRIKMCLATCGPKWQLWLSILLWLILNAAEVAIDVVLSRADGLQRKSLSFQKGHGVPFCTQLSIFRLVWVAVIRIFFFVFLTFYKRRNIWC